MKIEAHKCDGPECQALVASIEDAGWIRQEMEPWPTSGLQPYCEMVRPEAKSGNDMLFIYLTFCSKDCQYSWWKRHQRECRCHTRYMALLIRLPIPWADSDQPLYMDAGEMLEFFGRYRWPKGAEWVCGNCKGPAHSNCGEHYCEDPVCHSETVPCYSYGY